MGKFSDFDFFYFTGTKATLASDNYGRVGKEAVLIEWPEAI
jgi:hypothetical protein